MDVGGWFVGVSVKQYKDYVILFISKCRMLY